jgi:DNA-damage-inducible protein J
MGLSISDAIRLLMFRIAEERRLPFAVNVPNAATREAIAELEAGKGERFESVEALMADLNADSRWDRCRARSRSRPGRHAPTTPRSAAPGRDPKFAR